MEFKIGDRVRYTKDFTFRDHQLQGKLATIMYEDNQDGGRYYLEFDDNIGEHDCNGRCKEGHGLFIHKKGEYKGEHGQVNIALHWVVSSIELITEEPIVKEKPKFKVGDRIRFIGNCLHVNKTQLQGKLATIKYINSEVADGFYCLEFDDHINGHTSFGFSKDGHGLVLYKSSKLSQWQLSNIELVKEEELKFKVGDRVRYTGDYYYGATQFKGQLEGKLATIKHINHNCYCLEFDDHINGHTCHSHSKKGHGLCFSEKSSGWPISNLELVIKEPVAKEEPTPAKEIPKFKVGDRVRYIRDYVWGKNQLRGKLATIKYIDTYNSYYLEFDDHIDGSSCSSHCKRGHGLTIFECIEYPEWSVSNLELIKEELVAKEKTMPTEEKPKFSVGDRVRYTRDITNRGIQLKGKLATIKDIDEFYYLEFDDYIGSDHHYRGCKIGHGFGSITSGKNIELVTEEHTVKEEPMSTKEKPKFKVDDRVRYTGNEFREEIQLKSKLATIKHVGNEPDGRYSLEFDNNVNGHICDGHCKEEHGLFIYYEGSIWSANDIELVTEEEPKFKVEDRVRYTKDFTFNGHQLQGKLATIKNVGIHNYCLEFDDNIDSSNVYTFCKLGHGFSSDLLSDNLELVTKEEPKFKVGNRVRYTGDRVYCDHQLKGKLATINATKKDYLSKYTSDYCLAFDDHVSGHSGFNHNCKAGHGLFANHIDIELVKEEPIVEEKIMEPKFKVGDRVRYTGDCVWAKHQLRGKLATIKYIDGEDHYLEFDNHVDGGSCGGYCKRGHGLTIYECIEHPEWSISNLELVTEEPIVKEEAMPTEEKPKFKVNDRVRYTGDYNHRGHQLNGKLATIKHVNDSCYLEFDDNISGHSCMDYCKNEHGLYLSANDIELVTKEKPKLEVGSRVQYTKDYSFRGYQLKEKLATVVYKKGNNCYCLQFDDYMNGHYCDGHCKDGYGLFIFESPGNPEYSANNIELVTEEPVSPSKSYSIPDCISAGALCVMFHCILCATILIIGLIVNVILSHISEKPTVKIISHTGYIIQDLNQASRSRLVTIKLQDSNEMVDGYLSLDQRKILRKRISDFDPERKMIMNLDQDGNITSIYQHQ